METHVRRTPKHAHEPHRPRSRALRAAGGVTLVAALGLFARTAFQADAPSVSAGAPRAGEPAASGQAAREPVRRTWDLGASRAYALRLTQVSAVVPANPAQAPPGGAEELAYRVTVSGTWSVAVAGVDGGLVQLRASLASPGVTVTAGGAEVLPADAKASLSRDLERPLFLSVRESGVIDAIHFHKDTGPLARSVLRAAVASTHVVLDSADGERWETAEADAAGEFAASYRRVSGERRFERQKTRYLRVTTGSGLRPVAEAGTFEASGLGTFELDPSGWVAGLRAWETLYAAPKSAPLAAVTRVEASLRLTGAGADPSAIGSFVAASEALERAAMAGFDHGRSAQAEMDRQAVAGATLATLLAELRAANGDEGAALRAKLHGRLAALFRLDPASATDAARTIVKKLEGVGAETVVGALGAAGTREAQRALGELATDGDVPSDVRRNALGALAMVEAPTAETAAALASAATDADPEIRAQAALAQGAVAARQPAGGGDAVDDLIHRLRVATTPEERALYFEALGNSGERRRRRLI